MRLVIYHLSPKKNLNHRSMWLSLKMQHSSFKLFKKMAWFRTPGWEVNELARKQRSRQTDHCMEYYADCPTNKKTKWHSRYA